MITCSNNRKSHNRKVPQDEYSECHPGPHPGPDPGLQNLLQDFWMIDLTAYSINLAHNLLNINNCSQVIPNILPVVVPQILFPVMNTLSD